MNGARPRDPSRVSTRRRRNELEHKIQSAVIEWRDLQVKQFPELELLHAIPNGAKLPYRKKLIHGRVVRVSREAKKLKKEGLTAGIPDLCWPVPRGRFHGLYIEAKTPTGDVNKDQARKHALLIAQGYRVLVLRDPDAIINAIKTYWGLGPFAKD